MLGGIDNAIAAILAGWSFLIGARPRLVPRLVRVDEISDDGSDTDRSLEGALVQQSDQHMIRATKYGVWIVGRSFFHL